MVALALVTAARAAPTWQAPMPLSSGDRARSPELALAASGEALAVWDQEIGAECPTQPAGLSCIHVVTAASRSRDSTTWSPPTELSRPGVGSLPLAALDGSGNAAVAWIHDIGRDRVLQASYRRGTTGAWPEPSDVSEASLEVRSHRLALDAAGNAVLTWAERPRDGFDVLASFRDAASGAWFAPARLSSLERGVASGPDLTMTPGGAAAIAWVDRRDVVWVALGSTSTRTWGSPVALTEAGTATRSGPKVASDSAGNLAVVWAEHRPTEPAGTVAARLRPAAGGWSATDRFGSVGSSAGDEPNVAVAAGGSALAIWVDPAGEVQAASGPPGLSWSVRAVSRTGTRATRPRLALDERGNAVCLWSEGDNGPLRASVRPGASRTWQPPSRVASSAWTQHRVAIDDAADAVAVWEQIDGQKVVVESAQLTGGGPILEGMLVPRRTVVGSRAPMSVRPVPWNAPVAGTPLWRFGDGRSARGNRVAHRFARPGLYRVTVTSVDARGGSTSTTRTLRVTGRPR